MLWNKAVFCLKVLIYKRLQMWRHNDVIGRNEYLIFTLSESTGPWVNSLQFLFKSTHYTRRYERKCEWVFFFWKQCISVCSKSKMAAEWLSLQWLFDPLSWIREQFWRIVIKEVNPFDPPSQKTYPRVKHEVDRTTRSRDIVIWNFRDAKFHDVITDVIISGKPLRVIQSI